MGKHLNLSTANLVNQAADGHPVCAQCNTVNDPGVRFCKTCGSKLAEPGAMGQTPAFPEKPSEYATAKAGMEAAFPQKPPNTMDEKAGRETAAAMEPKAEPRSTLAEGLPDWNIEPLQVMVRRKR